MFRDPQRLCLQAAEETFERIRAARGRAPVQVAKLLGLIETRLLDPSLQVQALRRWAEIHDTNVSTRFAEELGLGPWEYITQCRMEIAVRLLVATDLKVWQIATNVGYADGHVFGRAFKRWSGQTAIELRRAARASSGRPEPLAAPADLVDQEAVRRALAGDLEPERAAAVVFGLGALHDQICANYRIPDPRVPYSEPVMAQALWRLIRPLSPEEQAKAVESHAAAFHTPALFNRLCTEAIEVGARDSVRGLQLAALTVQSLTGLFGKIDERLLPGFLVRAHGVAGNAFCRAGQLADAEGAFGVAYHALKAVDGDVHPVIVAEFFLYLSYFEIVRDNPDKAAEYLKMGTEIWQAYFARLERQRAGEGAV